MDKEQKKLLSELKDQGFRIEEVKSGWMIYPPDPNLQPVLIHKTESDPRASKNTLSRLKRSGFIPRKK